MPKHESNLGKALQNQQRKKYQDKVSKVSQPGQFIHNDKPADDEYQIQQRNLQSIIDQDTLNEYLCLAELANKKFDAEKKGEVVNASKQVLLNYNGVARLLQQPGDIYDSKRNLLMKDLRIPRRPEWNTKMTVAELRDKENEAFLAWRRGLASFEEKNYTITLTPYEKNIEVWKQLWRVVEKSDILVQVVDGRDILFFRCEDLELYVTETHPYQNNVLKLNFLLINKSDLLSEELRQAWSAYLNERGIKHVFFSAKWEQEKQEKVESEEKVLNILEMAPTEVEDVFNTHKIANTNTLLKELKKLALSIKGDRERVIEETKEQPNYNYKNVCIGMVGYPNVGKSSVINTLCNRKLVGVAPRPGKTKHFQTIQLQEDIMLCDCPGLVFPNAASSRAEMVCNGILPIDNMKDHLSPMDVLASRIPKIIFEKLYGINLKEQKDLTSTYVLQTYAKKRGFVTGNVMPDEAKASRIMLKDFIKGRLLYVKPPPGAPADLWTSNKLADLDNLIELNQVEEERILKQHQPDMQPQVRMTNEDLMEIFSQQDLLQMMEGRKVHGVKLTKEQRREIKFAYGRGEQIDLKKYLNPREDQKEQIYKAHKMGHKV